MPWPDDYFAWSANITNHEIELAVRNRLQMFTFFTDIPRPGGIAIRTTLAEEGRVRAFQLAEDLQNIPGYFADEDEYKRWLRTVACREGLRVMFYHPSIAIFLARVTPIQASLLRFLYIDQFTYEDLARTLPAVSSSLAQRLADAQQRARAAYDALRQVLIQGGWHRPGVFPFPPYPAY